MRHKRLLPLFYFVWVLIDILTIILTPIGHWQGVDGTKEDMESNDHLQLTQEHEHPFVKVFLWGDANVVSFSMGGVQVL